MNTFSILRILFFCCLGHFVVDFMVGIWPVYKTIAHVDLLIAGLIAGGCAFISEGFQVVFGYHADRGYQRSLLALSFVLAAFSSFFPQVASSWGFLLLYFATLIGSASFHPTASSLLGSLPLTNRRHTVMGLFSAFGMLGLGLSHMVFSWVYTSFDNRTAFLAVPPVLLALLALAAVKGEKRNATRPSFSFQPIIHCFKNSTLRALFFALVGNQMLFWSLVFLLPDFLQSRGYESWIVFGGGHLCLMAGAALAPALFGYIADKSSARFVLIVLTIAYVALFYLLLWQTVSSMVLLINLFFLGSFLASFSPIVWSLGNQLEPNNSGTVSAFLMGFVWMISESFGVGASGVVAGLFETNGPEKSLACMGLASFITLYFILKVPKRMPLPEPI